MSIEQKLIVFGSDPDFADNSRGFWEYINENTDYQTCWIIKNQTMYELLKSKGIECALEGSDYADEMVDKAHYLITSSFDFAYKKRPEQVHIAAWHGFPLKVIGFFDSATVSKNNYDGLKIVTTQTDLVTATSRFSHLTLSGMFAIDPRKVSETGYPRNDIMFHSDAKKELQKLVDINVEDSKLFFYLPTMRKGLKDEGEHFEKNIFNYQDYNVEELDKFLEKRNAYIVAKVHFADNELYKSGDFKLPKRLIFLDTDIMNSNMCTIYHIMDAFDGLITDYSSIYVDYLLLDKPIIFSCPDIEKYRADRGFIVDDPALLMPGAIVKAQDQLIKNMSDIINGDDAYKETRKNLMPFFHNHLDGKSSERLFEEMINLDVQNRVDSGKQVGHLFQKNVSPLDQYVDNEVQAEIFIDRGAGFNEDDKLIKRLRLSDTQDGIISSIEIDVDENVKMVRFDPDDIGRAVISSLEIYCGDQKQQNYSIIGGHEYNGQICFSSVDPQIIIPVNVDSSCKLKLVFNSYDFYSCGGKLIEGVINDNAVLNNNLAEKNDEINRLRTELNTVYSSTSWKMTGWYRKLGDLIKGRNR